MDYFVSSVTSASSCAREAAFNVDRMVTTGSTVSMFLKVSTMAFICFAAIGAQLPFSIKATLRFW